MSETLAARDFILDFLRREIIGPSPLPPDVQENGEEILRPQDSPRQRYGAGALFPMKALAPTQDETAEDEQGDHNAASPDSSDILGGPTESDSLGGRDTRPETDDGVNLSNQYLPSAMGLSALVDVPETLRVEISAATYRQGDAPVPPGARPRKGKSWFRQPFTRTIEFRASQLLGSGNKSLERPVVSAEGKPSLVLHALSRPHGRSDRSRLITFTLINRLQVENQAPRNTDCFFQCEFRVLSPDGQACFLSYPERAGSKDDPEELSLQLLHLHKQSFAVGHGCSAEWDEPVDGRTALVRTEVLPVYEVPIKFCSGETRAAFLSRSTGGTRNRDNTNKNHPVHPALARYAAGT